MTRKDKIGTDPVFIPVSPPRWQLALVALVLVAAVWLVYGQVRSFDFVGSDDIDYVTQNPHVLQGLTPATVRWAFTTRDAANWHPLTWLSHELDVTLFGPRPGPHHLTSVVLHSLNSVLLLLLLVRLTGALWPSAIVAALFALHPLHVQSVAWIAERKDVLSTLFFLLTLLAYVSWTRRRGSFRYLLAVSLFALGLMSKPMLVTLPFVLLLLDFWPLGRMNKLGSYPSFPRTKSQQIANPQSALHDSIFDIRYSAVRRFWPLLLEKLPLFILSAASCLITWSAQQSGGAMVATTVVPLSLRLHNALASYAVYLREMLWPTGLIFHHPYRPVSAEATVLPLAILAAITITAVLLVRRRPWLLTGWLWYLGMLVPVLGLVHVGDAAHADRYTYLPLVGIFIMIVWTVAELVASSRPARLAAGAVAALLLIVCGLLSWSQAATWKDSLTLCSYTLAIDPDNPLAENNLGIALAGRGDVRGALAHFRRALDIKPYAYIYINYAHALGLLGQSDDAIAACRQALALDPASSKAKDALNALLAEKSFKDGAAKFQAGRFADAAASFRRTIELQPQRADAHNNLAATLNELGQIDEALRQWRQAIALNPNQADALDNLAWRLATLPDDRLRDGPEAVRLAERAVNLTARHNPAFLETLAAAYAEAGRFPDAVATAREAAALAAASNRPDLARSINQRLQFYQSARPFREPQTRVVP